MKKIEFHKRDGNQTNLTPSKGEKRLAKILTVLEVNFERERIFDDLKYRSNLRFDFYLPDHNLLIEFQGRQHFSPNEAFGGESSLREQKYKDELKREYCDKNGLDLLYINYNASDVEIFDFLNNHLFEGKRSFKSNLFLIENKEREVSKITKAPKVKSFSAQAFDIKIEFVNELKPNFVDYEKLTLKGYFRTGLYYPNHQLYDNMSAHIIKGLDKYKDFIKKVENNSFTGYHYQSFAPSIVNDVWWKIWEEIKIEINEYKYLDQKAKDLFQSYDRPPLYQKNILGISKRIRKFQRQVFKTWKRNRAHYNIICSNL